jgi:hypothetical protein
MVAVEVSRSNDAKWLGVHALVVGVGWFVVAFAGLVGLQAIDGFRHWGRELAGGDAGHRRDDRLGCCDSRRLAFFIAIGWYESGLAERIRSGDDSARRPAVRLLCAQALAFATASVLAGGVALLFRGSIGSEYVLLAWLPLALIAALHVRTATTLIR